MDEKRMLAGLTKLRSCRGENPAKFYVAAAFRLSRMTVLIVRTLWRRIAPAVAITRASKHGECDDQGVNLKRFPSDALLYAIEQNFVWNDLVLGGLLL
jgi:hypothetical protein